MTRALTLILLAVVLVAGVAAPPPAAADDRYPTRPVTIVNPFPPGGLSDVITRPLAAVMEPLLKQPVVILNKSGAAGAVGAQYVSTAKPDGYTLLTHIVSISVFPEVDALFGRAPKYTRDQFVPIARLNADPPVLIVGAETPWKTVKELVDDARKRGGDIIFSSSGPYGALHLPMEMFLRSAGIKMRHLPTTGGGPAMTALLGGHSQVLASTVGVAAPHIRSGKVRPLAVFGHTRLAHFPDVPTLKELGHDVEFYVWAGLFAPRGTPPAAVAVLGDAVREAVRHADFRKAMENAGLVIAYQDGPEFKTWWDRDAAAIATTVKAIGKIEGQ
jgi:tripartite-type tricarboxylate transporter receptor subunit TctC